MKMRDKICIYLCPC